VSALDIAAAKDKSKEKKKKEKDKKAKSTEEDEAFDDERRSVPTFYYKVIKTGVHKYLQRVHEGKAALHHPKISNESPWAFYNICMTELQKATNETQVKDTLSFVLKQCNAFFETSEDFQKRALFEFAKSGSALAASIDYLMTHTNPPLTKEQAIEQLKMPRTRAYRLLGVFEFCNKYNLILYSGITISELYEFRVRLDKFLQANPEEAYFLMGEINSENSFPFDTVKLTFSNNVLQNQPAMKKKRQKKQRKKMMKSGRK